VAPPDRKSHPGDNAYKVALQRFIKLKADKFSEVRRAYEPLTKDPSIGNKAMARIGLLYDHLGITLISLPPPAPPYPATLQWKERDAFSREFHKTFIEELEKKARPLFARARGLYTVCARQTGPSSWSRFCANRARALSAF
jgi:hypothetical protein